MRQTEGKGVERDKERKREIKGNETKRKGKAWKETKREREK